MKRIEKVLNTIRELPGCSSNEITALTDEDPKRVTATLSVLFQSGQVIRQGIKGGGGRPGSGYRYYINEGRPKPRKYSGRISSRKTIEDYTPQELLSELKKRGYVWDKMWVESRQYIEYKKI